ncbi:hypothetical protein BVC93_09865 [Mycobacterium sp. MS1601]|uniref:septum site-determining protein Ssd n=1 Tax=Mycobacterium sp. MS1601 TaxID=1936029 RepID=UPI0009794BD6|nr:septum site-determining protein Ssd [Mycobacterium sp. MS1601]AQA06276.1 hypothetical protein BVC93_09865 [Mycobacterium sp. MS1601]
MTETAGLLTLIAESALRDDVDRAAAAAGVRAAHLDSSTPPTRKVWSAAAAVALDVEAARRCADAGLPRRPALFVCSLGEFDAITMQTAISVGAQNVLTLPDQADTLVRGIADARVPTARLGGRGTTVAVIGGRGGAGASVFAAALALHVSEPLLMDLDPCGGGIDLLLGAENTPGLRWPDLAVQSGRLSWEAVRSALPRHGEVTVLSAARHSHEMPAGAVTAVLEASRRHGITAVCDLPRLLTDPVTVAIDDADLVVVVTTCDVRGCAATVAMAPVVSAVNPNVGLVVRGPAPGGLRAAEIAELTGLPLLAAMRPEPLVTERLEHGGLRVRARSPLAAAARRVATVLADHTVEKAA